MRGQVTIYVILGIVIVAALAGVFLLKDYILKSEFEREIDKLGFNDEIEVVYDYFVGGEHGYNFRGGFHPGGICHLPERVYPFYLQYFRRYGPAGIILPD